MDRETEDMLRRLAAFAAENGGIGDKNRLCREACARFGLRKDGCVFANGRIAVRFCQSRNGSFSNTVMALSRLKKYDDRPCVACLVTPSENRLFLVNTTFLQRISHSSQMLAETNVKGSFNGSDILRNVDGIDNCGDCLTLLYPRHEAVGFEGNLARLVAATRGIVPTGERFEPDGRQRERIFQAVERAVRFVRSPGFDALKAELDGRVRRQEEAIVRAGSMENVNLRGRTIESLITGGEDGSGLLTRNRLGDFSWSADGFVTETDIKSKTTGRHSNPKGFNLDKFLRFLSEPGSVFLFYFVGVGPQRVERTALVPVFAPELLETIRVQKHWAGRNSRGAVQFSGETVAALLAAPRRGIDREAGVEFLEKLLG